MTTTLGVLSLTLSICSFLVSSSVVPGLGTNTGAAQGRSRERVYYVGIIEANWDYAPSGKNLLDGRAIVDDE